MGLPESTATREIDLDGFVNREYRQVVAAVRRIVGPGADAEDAVQDALVKFVQRGPEERPIESLAAWVTVVASNSARSRARSRGSEDRAFGRLRVALESGPQNPGAAADGRIDLDRALQTLPDRQRQIATLFYLLDTPITAIAKTMSISEGTVKTQLSRARAALAAALGLGTDSPGGGSDD